MQAGPEVGVLGEGGEGAGRTATPLVGVDCRGEHTVHPDRPLRTHSLLIIKHLLNTRRHAKMVRDENSLCHRGVLTALRAPVFPVGVLC